MFAKPGYGILQQASAAHGPKNQLVALCNELFKYRYGTYIITHLGVGVGDYRTVEIDCYDRFTNCHTSLLFIGKQTTEEIHDALAVALFAVFGLAMTVAISIAVTIAITVPIAVSVTVAMRVRSVEDNRHVV